MRTQRRAQLQQTKARLAARKEARARRVGPKWKTSDITLENIDRLWCSLHRQNNPVSIAQNRQALPETDENSLFPSEFSDGMIPTVDIVLEETERIWPITWRFSR